MPRSIFHTIGILSIIFCCATANGQPLPVDSVVYHVRNHAPDIGEFHASLYIKSQLDIIKKNRFFRYIPGLFKSRKDENRYLSETVIQVHYSSPNIYDRKIMAYTGTIETPKRIPGTSDFFYINIYSPYILGDKILSPLSSLAKRHYTYQIDSIGYDRDQRRVYHVHYIPKNKSVQLVEGHMSITEGSWSVREMTIKGRHDLLKFQTSIRFGETGTPEEHLMVQQHLYTSYGFAYNIVESYYDALTTYQDIVPVQTAQETYNRTASYTLHCNKEAYVRNPALFDSLRPQPLTPHEASIYNKYKTDSLKSPTLDNITRRQRWQPAADLFFGNNTWIKDERTVLRSSPFINPLLLSFSKSQGIAYRQEVRFNHTLQDASSLLLQGRIGYNFKYNELYWGLAGNYMYLPERNGYVGIDIGNGNRISNSRIVDRLKEIPNDSVIDFKRLNLTTFRDLRLGVNHHIEITNGLSAEFGLIFHRRTPTRNPSDYLREGDLPQHVEEGIKENVRPQYISFAPRVRIKWSPGQYYYMNGRNKINLDARFPSFSFDYERGIPNVLGSSSLHERIEVDMHHHIRLGLFSHLYYRVGAGAFTQQENAYFVDFVNFNNHELPQGWNDEISGTFQALNRKWYYSSPHYVRAHITYEAPFLLIPHLMKQTAYVKNERLYLNVLTMPRLDYYMELGYGINTFVFDLGLFLSVEKFQKVGFGYKLTLKLFDE